MKPKVIQARFFATPKGNRPVHSGLLTLSKEDKKVVGEDIRYVEYQWPVGMPLVRPLSKGLYGVRGTLASGNQYRVFFCVFKGIMALLHAILKKTKKTPPRAIALAKERQRQLEGST